MNALQAMLYDGRGAQGLAVALTWEVEHLAWGSEPHQRCAAALVRWPAVGEFASPVRSALLPGGQTLQSTDVTAWDAWFAARPGKHRRPRTPMQLDNPRLAAVWLVALCAFASMALCAVAAGMWWWVAPHLAPPLAHTVFARHGQALVARVAHSDTGFWRNRESRWRWSGNAGADGMKADLAITDALLRALSQHTAQAAANQRSISRESIDPPRNNPAPLDVYLLPTGQIWFTEELMTTATRRLGAQRTAAGAQGLWAVQAAHVLLHHDATAWVRRSALGGLGATVLGDASGAASLIGGLGAGKRLSPAMLHAAAQAALQAMREPQVPALSPNMATDTQALHALVCERAAASLGATPQELHPYSLAAHCDTRASAGAWPAVAQTTAAAAKEQP